MAMATPKASTRAAADAATAALACATVTPPRAAPGIGTPAAAGTPTAVAAALLLKT